MKDTLEPRSSDQKDRPGSTEAGSNITSPWLLRTVRAHKVSNAILACSQEQTNYSTKVEHTCFSYDPKLS